MSTTAEASLSGTAVDYLSRLADGAEPEQAFAISLLGARNLDATTFRQAQAAARALTGSRIDEAAIVTACRLASYDVAYRVGPHAYRPGSACVPDAATIEHIRIMVARSTTFFQELGPVIADGFTFPGAYTKLITSGDGDVLTADTLWDFKVSAYPPTKEHTLQLLIYAIMGQHSTRTELRSISKIGVFNPRLNTGYRITLAEIPADMLDIIARDVIGY